MANTAAGPASNTAEVVLGVSNWLEVQVTNGLPSLGPSSAPIFDAGVAPTNYQGNAATPINSAFNFGGTAGSVIVNPA